MVTKLALIGAGSIGRVHAANIARHPDAELVAVCDPQAEVGSQIADEYGGDYVASVDDALAMAPNGAIIASSTASHGTVAEACIDAGVPFLCEKPLASDLTTANRIADLADRAGLTTAMAFNRRLDAGYSGIRDAILEGKIGDVETLLFTSRTASPPTVEFTRTSGGLFGEKGAHFFDLARWITGEEPVALFAMGSALINPEFAAIGEVDTAMVTMRMNNGTLCQFDFSWRAAYGQDERLEVNGSHGMLTTFQEPVERFRSHTSSGEYHRGLLPTWYERFESTYREELEHFISAIAEEKDSKLPSLREGYLAQAISDAAKQSVTEGRQIQLSWL